jgi:hypothetical protein
MEIVWTVGSAHLVDICAVTRRWVMKSSGEHFRHQRAQSVTFSSTALHVQPCSEYLMASLRKQRTRPLIALPRPQSSQNQTLHQMGLQAHRQTYLHIPTSYHCRRKRIRMLWTCNIFADFMSFSVTHRLTLHLLCHWPTLHFLRHWLTLHSLRHKPTLHLLCHWLTHQLLCHWLTLQLLSCHWIAVKINKRQRYRWASIASAISS